jgi:hypothetical protein
MIDRLKGPGIDIPTHWGWKNHYIWRLFGIAGYHWIWLVIPIYVYAVASIIPIMSFLSFNFLHGDESYISGVLGFVLFLTAIGAFLPLLWGYLNLRVAGRR